MANRYPLIIDVADGNKIKELPDGDNLYLRGNNIEQVEDINALGTINAAAIRIAGQRLVAQQFTDLTDVPSSYTGQANKFLKVNSGETGVDFVALSDLGNVTVSNLTVNGGSIFPAVDLNHQVGKSDKRFWQMHAESFYGNLRGTDGTLVFNADTNQIPYAAIFGAPTALSELTNDMGFVDSVGVDDAVQAAIAALASVRYDVIGSVFADDSTPLIDAVSAKINLDGTVKGNIIPDQDSVYDLGSTTRKFKDLYLSGSSIYLGDAVITSSGSAVNLPAGSTINGISIGSGGAGVDLTAFSVGPDATASGAGAIAYNNTTGVFTYTPPDLENLGVVSATSITADSLEFTGVGVVTVESGSNLVLNAANGAGNIVASGSRITNVADPVGIQDVATKSYVDSLIVGGTASFFDGDMKGSVFADDSTLLVDGVAGVLKANVEVDSNWTVTTGDKTWSFIYGDIGEGTTPTLEFPGNLQAVGSQTAIFARTGDLSSNWGMSIDAGNSPYYVDIGELSGSNYWRFSGDGSLTLPGELHGAPVISGGAFPSQVGRTVNITPADDASDKSFKFRIDQYGETFTRAYLEFPTAEVDKQVAAVFPHTNGKAGYIFTQGTDTFNDGLNDAFNIFYNAGDIKLTAMTPVAGTLNTWKFGSNGDLTLPGNLQSEGNIDIDINLSDSTLRRWRFGEDGNLNLAGNLQFPNGAEIRDVSGDLRLRAAPGDVAQLQGLTTDGAVDAAVKAFHNIETGSYVTINTNIDAGAPEHVWTFDYNGDLTFPDGSVQTTAYTEPSVTTFEIDATTVSTAGLAGADTIVIAPAIGYAGSDAQSLGFTGRNVAGRRTLVINTSTLCTVDFDFGNMIGPLTVTPSTIVEVIYTGNDWFTISSNSI